MIANEFSPKSNTVGNSPIQRNPISEESNLTEADPSRSGRERETAGVLRNQIERSRSHEIQAQARAESKVCLSSL